MKYTEKDLREQKFEKELKERINKLCETYLLDCSIYSISTKIYHLVLTSILRYTYNVINNKGDKGGVYMDNKKG